MINQTKALNLVKNHSSICERFEKGLKYSCQGFSTNNNRPRITPVKAVKGECQEIRNRNKAANKLFSVKLQLFLHI